MLDSCEGLADFLRYSCTSGEHDAPLVSVLRRELPKGCFCSTGLKELQLPRDFYELGAHACDNCKLLNYPCEHFGYQH